MQQTLFFLPHWLFQGPLLVAWLVVGLLILVGLFLRSGNSSDTWSFLPVYAIVAAVIVWVLPSLEVSGINPEDPAGPLIPSGLAIRGYGLFLLTAIVAGVSLAAWRASWIGVTTDQVMQLAFWMLVCGIAGARAFYVLQKPDEFFADGFSLTSLQNAVNMTKGGLVVYGSLIGGSLAGLGFMWWQQMPIWKTADMIAPGMVLGLAIGRLGCLMNGCCFGGVCEPPYPAVTFPAGSPPYMRQLIEGDLLGLDGQYDLKTGKLKVESVLPESLGQPLGIEPGDTVAVRMPVGSSELLRFQKSNPQNELAGKLQIYIESDRSGLLPLTLAELPARSRRTHPTQIYSSLNAFLLCVLLWFYWTMRRHDGEVFAWMLILYPIARFLMEIVRQDERGQFGTELTISQWVSIFTIVIGFSLLAYAKFANPRANPQANSAEPAA